VRVAGKFAGELDFAAAPSFAAAALRFVEVQERS